MAVFRRAVKVFLFLSLGTTFLFIDNYNIYLEHKHSPNQERTKSEYLKHLADLKPPEPNESATNTSNAPINVLLVVFDDLRPAMGVYGDPEVLTPNFDQLASLGTVFKNAFVQVSQKIIYILAHPLVLSPDQSSLLLL